MAFLHLLEQNHNIVPSFLTYINPVPGGISLPQKLQVLTAGIFTHVFDFSEVYKSIVHLIV